MTPIRSFYVHAVACAALVAAVAGRVEAQTQVTRPNTTTTAGPTTVTLGGQTFVNSGLVGMGRILAGTRDFNNDTLGAFSGMDLKLSTWRKTATGYTGGLFGLPDRGPNGIGQVSFSNYAGRLNSYTFTFTPYTGTANLPAATSSQNQLALTQDGGILLRDFNGNVTTGLDPGTGAASVITQNGIQLPGQSTGVAAGKIALDAEAVRFLRDGSFYVSDEYGSNVYYFDATGRLQGVILPPAALLPRNAAGQLSYSSLVDAATGRRVNQGLEGMAITPDGKKLVTIAQSATMQDSTSAQQTRTNTRLMVYDISATRTPTAPVADYVVQLPIFTQNGGGGAPNRTAAQSELLALNDTQFLVLSRDGLGLGQNVGNPVFKSVLLVDTSQATNIAGTNFETTTAPISPGGALNSTIRPVQQVELVNLLNSTQVAKFGENLNNVTPTRLTIAEKWEGMALAPALDESAPQDFFLFVGNDNDFLSTTCRVNNEDCSQAVDSDSHVMVYRLTLPTAVDPLFHAAMVESGPMMLEVLGQSATGVASVNMANIAAHMNAARQVGWTPANRVSAWGSAAYNRNHWDDLAGGGEARYGRAAGTFGIDIGVVPGATIGATFGYGEADPETAEGFSATTSGVSYGGNARFFNTRVFMQAAYSHGSYTSEGITRPAAYGLTAVGATDANNNSLLIGGGVTFGTAAVMLTPFLDYRFNRTTFDAFTETGAAGGNLEVPTQRFTRAVAAFGAEAVFTVGRVVPVIHAAYNGVLSGAHTTTLKLASAAAEMASQTVTNPATESYASAGGGLQQAFGRGFWHIDYTVEFPSGQMNSIVTGGLGFSF